MVSFGQSMKICLKTKIFTLRDRAPRSEFWWFMLGAFLLNIILEILNIVPILGQLLCLIGGIWLLIASISVSVRRLHDLDKSGWWLLFPYLAFFVGLIVMAVGMALSSDINGTAVAGFVIIGVGIISVFVLWIMMIVRGTVGPNRFGPDPLAEATITN